MTDNTTIETELSYTPPSTTKEILDLGEWLMQLDPKKDRIRFVRATR